MNEVVVGVDCGSSGVRVVAMGRDLIPVHEATGRGPAPGAEQSVEEYVDLAASLIRNVADKCQSSGDRVAAISLAGTASNLAFFGQRAEERGPWGVALQPVTAASSWLDARAGSGLAAFVEEFSAYEIYTTTGCPPHESYWPAKLAERLGTARAPREHALGGVKDYLFHVLTGEWATDPSTAAATGMYDAVGGDWSPPFAEFLGVEKAALPNVLEFSDTVPVTPRAARVLGIDPSCVVSPGGMDGLMAHLGMGCTSSTMSLTTGTSSAARQLTPSRHLDPKMRLWCYPAPENQWLVGGASNAGGNVVDWLLGNLLPHVRGIEELFDKMTPAEQRTELLVLPYLFGERTPLWSPEVSGAILGLRPEDDAGTITRATLEGIAYAIKEMAEILEEQTGPSSATRAGGGLARHDSWLQLLSDVLARPIGRTRVSHASATGAALLAFAAIDGVGVGDFAGAIQPDVVAQESSPTGRHNERYQRFLAIRSTLMGELT